MHGIRSRARSSIPIGRVPAGRRGTRVQGCEGEGLRFPLLFAELSLAEVGRLKVGDLERYGDPVKLGMMRAVKAGANLTFGSDAAARSAAVTFWAFTDAR